MAAARGNAHDEVVRLLRKGDVEAADAILGTGYRLAPAVDAQAPARVDELEAEVLSG